MSVLFKETRKLIGEAFDNIADNNVKDGLSNLLKIGTNTITKPPAALASFIKTKFKIDNLKATQKIIPYAILAITIPITVAAMVVAVAGLSTIAPPFMVAASLAGVARSIGTFISDKRSLDNLNKQLITEDKIFKKIDKAKLTNEDKHILKISIVLPQEIYKGLYELRQNVIENTKLATKEKNNLIKEINGKIEEFHDKGTSKSTISLTASGSAEPSITQLLAHINVKIEDLNKVKKHLSQPDSKISSKLRKQIDYHKNTHEHIHAQDLPLTTKDKMLGLLKESKMGRSDHKEIYAQMVNHSINLHSEVQKQALDKAVVNYIKSHSKDLKKDLSKEHLMILKEHLILPRLIYNQIKEIHDTLPKDKRESFREKIISEMEKSPDFDVLSKINEFMEKSPEFKDSQMSKDLISIITKDERRKKEVTEMKLPEADRSLLDRHRHGMMIRTIQTGGLDVPSPRIDNKLFLTPPEIKESRIGKYLHEKIGKSASEKIDKAVKVISDPFVKIVQKAKFSAMRKWYGEDKAMEIMLEKENIKSAKSEFRAQFGDAHTFMQCAEERNFLKHAVKRDILNIGLSVTSLGVTVAGTAVTLAAVSGGPAAAGASAAFAVATTVVAGTAMANTGILAIQNLQSMAKATDANKIAESVTKPTVKSEMNEINRTVEHAEKKQKSKEKKIAKKEEKMLKKIEKSTEEAQWKGTKNPQHEIEVSQRWDAKPNHDLKPNNYEESKPLLSSCRNMQVKNATVQAANTTNVEKPTDDKPRSRTSTRPSG